MVYPLDTIKVQQQTKPHASIKGIATNILQQQGIRGLYTGLSSPGTLFKAFILWCCSLKHTAMWCGAAFATSFFVYSSSIQTIQLIHPPRNNWDVVSQSTIAGGIAGLVQSPIRQVMERTKTVMQARPGRYNGSFDCMRQLIRNEGLSLGLFRGQAATTLREVPQFAVYYGAFETAIRTMATNGEDPRSLPAWKIALAGSIAGFSSWLPPIFQADVVKTRMQSARPGLYSGLLDCIVKTHRYGGPGVWWRGYFPITTLRSLPMHACVFLVYNEVMKLLRPIEEIAPVSFHGNTSAEDTYLW